MLFLMTCLGRLGSGSWPGSSLLPHCHVTLTQLVNSSKAKHKRNELPGCFSEVLLASARQSSQAASWLPSVITAQGFVWEVPCRWLISPHLLMSPVLLSFFLHEMNLWCGDESMA